MTYIKNIFHKELLFNYYTLFKSAKIIYILIIGNAWTGGYLPYSIGFYRNLNIGRLAYDY